MAEHGELPTHLSLVADLRELRRRGLKALRTQCFPALEQLTHCRQSPDDDADHAAVEDTVRTAVARLGDGPLSEAARLSFGLSAGTRGMAAADRRRQAAAVFGLQPDTFRKQPEADLLSEIASELRRLATEPDQADDELEQAAETASSVLAIYWAERFEAYYRIWTPISGLRGDLVAALELRREGGDQVDWTEYAAYAFMHYARFSLALHDFVTEYGGMWLLGDADAETAVAEAVHQVWRQTPLSERDDSWLRTAMATVEDLELHGFLSLTEETDTGRVLLEEWQEWIAECTCGPEGSTPECSVHAMIAQCERYMGLIDEACRKVSPVSHLGVKPI